MSHGLALGGMLVVAVVAFGAFHAHVLFPVWSDENVHLYVARQLTRGDRLYSDVHSARPPLAIVPLAALIRLGLPPLASARVCVIGAAIGCAAVLFVAARRHWGWGPAVFTPSLFLLSPALASRYAFTGIGLVTLGVTFCVALALSRRDALSGVAGGLALSAGQHAAVIVAAVAIGTGVSRGGRAAARHIAGLIGTLSMVLGTTIVLGGDGVFVDVIGRHLYHADLGGGDARLGWWLTTWSLENGLLLALAGIGFLFAPTAAKESRSRRPLAWLRTMPPERVSVLLAGLHIATVVGMRGGQILYVHLVVPLLAFAGGGGAAAIARVGRRLRSTVPEAAWRIALASALFAIAFVGFGWTGASAMFEQRDRREYPVVPHARLSEMARMRRPGVVADIVAAIAAAETGRVVVFGHPNVAALVALDGNGEVAANLVDLAPRWFSTGGVSRVDVTRAIESGGVGWFISPRWFYLTDAWFSSYLRRCYSSPTVFPRKPGSGIPRIFLFRRRDAARPCLPAPSKPQAATSR